jgi:hypothetical protein
MRKGKGIIPDDLKELTGKLPILIWYLQKWSSSVTTFWANTYSPHLQIHFMKVLAINIMILLRQVPFQVWSYNLFFNSSHDSSLLTKAMDEAKIFYQRWELTCVYFFQFFWMLGTRSSVYRMKHWEHMGIL